MIRLSIAALLFSATAAAVERQPPCPRATTTLAGFQAAEVGVFVDFLG